VGVRNLKPQYLANGDIIHYTKKHEAYHGARRDSEYRGRWIIRRHYYRGKMSREEHTFHFVPGGLVTSNFTKWEPGW